MSLPLSSPPRRLCLLRLSAIGDISHTLPLLRTLQAAWPQTQISWIIGKTEHALVGDIPGVDFIIFDKSRRWRAFADLHHALRGQRFDLLLHLQTSLRASLASLLVRAPIRLGFDRARARDGQWLFTNQKIAPAQRQHVIDSFFGFSEALGIRERLLQWEIPIPESAHHFAEARLPGGKFIVISPCSSMAYRNWTARGYAAVAKHAIEQFGLKVVLCGGNSRLERLYGAEIAASLDMAQRGDSLTNLIGQTDLKQLLAVLQRAEAVISPDAGPAHLATAVGTPVVGLYACTNPDRARPYLSAEYVVNRYPEAVEAKYGRAVAELSWGIRVRDEGTMARIAVADVTAVLDRLLDAVTPN
ncbi:MAG: glycosyltransferase family 9 protein [Gammaproteobacteria bacterium]|nr:glycosyltransferase family 9 protein [Gammaproteobacteria bacterium]